MGFDEEQKFVSVVVPHVREDRRASRTVLDANAAAIYPHETLLVEGSSWADAINAGCAQAAGNYLIWLDPAIGVRPDWDRQLMDIFRVYARCGLAVPRRIRSQEFVTLGEPYRRYPHILVDEVLDLGCAMIPLWIYRTVGPLDARYELPYLAQADYYRRLRAHDFFIGVSGLAVLGWDPFGPMTDDELLAYDSHTDHAIHRDRRRSLEPAALS